MQYLVSRLCVSKYCFYASIFIQSWDSGLLHLKKKKMNEIINSPFSLEPVESTLIKATLDFRGRILKTYKYMYAYKFTLPCAF